MNVRSLFLIIGSLFFTGTAFAQTTTFSQKPFTDVPANSADFQAIEYLRTQNVIKGYLDGTFKPDTRINRAEFVEFVINPFILDTSDRGTCVKQNVMDTTNYVFFSDVSRDSWYAENVCFAKIKQIIDGYPDGTFHPADSISFVEASKIISNVFSLHIDEYQTGEFWYRGYVQRLSDLHAIPTSIRNFTHTITRGEIAQIVYRLKVDSTHKASMEFNQESNTLSQRAQTVAPVTNVPKSPTALYMGNRPSRRSIVSEAESDNKVGTAQ